MRLTSIDPAHVDVGGEVGAQGDRRDFGRVGGGDGLEDTARLVSSGPASYEYKYSIPPWNTAENLPYQEDFNVGREEEDEDEAGNQGQGAQHGTSVSQALRDQTANGQTYDLSHLLTIAEAGLPGRWNREGAVWLEHTVLFRELGKTVEAGEEKRS